MMIDRDRATATITEPMLDALRERVVGLMSDKRAKHTLAVERMVCRLAQLYSRIAGSCSASRHYKGRKFGKAVAIVPRVWYNGTARR